jgi:hypothetical protein
MVPHGLVLCVSRIPVKYQIGPCAPFWSVLFTLHELRGQAMAKRASDTVQIKLRAREDFRRKLEREAEKRGLTVNAEILRRLEASLLEDETRARDGERGAAIEALVTKTAHATANALAAKFGLAPLQLGPGHQGADRRAAAIRIIEKIIAQNDPTLDENAAREQVAGMLDRIRSVDPGGDDAALLLEILRDGGLGVKEAQTESTGGE